jgi:phospholipase B1
MDTLAWQYDDAIRTVVRGWQAENDPHFGVTFQPGSLVNIKNSPLTALSPADCFHPSLESHKRFAAGVWNRMATTQDKRDIETKWENDVWIRCVEESDRILLNQI